MTNKQIKELMNTLPSVTCVSYDSWSEEEKQLDKELSCRKMINSCLCYETDFLNSEYCKDYIKELGMKRVKELYNEQLEHFNNCILLYNVYEDSEGVTYNNIIEPKEDGYIHCEIVEEPIFNSVIETIETYFSVKLKDEYGRLFSVGLSPNVNNNYEEYYIGREIGIKVEKTNLGIYKAVDVTFFQNEMEAEI